jgi:metallo-beta-lactamase family protein
MPACDALIMESTYGGMAHEPPERSKERLADIIERTSGRGGKVIIPAFAVGRTQEIVYALDQLWEEGRLSSIPVFVDSPLAVNATGVYLAHPECFDRETIDTMRDGDGDPLGFDRLTYIRNVAQSKKLNNSRMPMVIISASGMCEGGRILHHLRNNIEDPKNTVLMVGYCADHTLGKRLIQRQPTVNIFGEPHTLRADVEVMNSYSAHADEAGLLQFIEQVEAPPERFFLVHGAPSRQEALEAALREHGYADVLSPAHGETVEL